MRWWKRFKAWLTLVPSGVLPDPDPSTLRYLPDGSEAGSGYVRTP